MLKLTFSILTLLCLFSLAQCYEHKQQDKQQTIHYANLLCENGYLTTQFQHDACHSFQARQTYHGALNIISILD